MEENNNIENKLILKNKNNIAITKNASHNANFIKKNVWLLNCVKR